MVAGDLVNTASRLQSVAPPGTRARRRGDARAPPPAPSRSSRPASSCSRARRRRSRRGGPCASSPSAAGAAAREAPRGAVRRARRGAAAAQGPASTPPAREQRLRLVSVIGPAGIGKSRLAWEFLKYIDGVVEDVCWHQGRSPAYGEGITFWALGEMVRGARRAGRDATTRRRPAPRIAATVAQHVPGRDGARAGSSRRCWRCSGVGGRRGGARASCSGPGGTFFERIAATAPVVARVRGPPLGRLRPARLHRPPARLVPRPSRSRRHAGPAGAARAPPGLGRRQAALHSLCT